MYLLELPVALETTELGPLAAPAVALELGVPAVEEAAVAVAQAGRVDASVTPPLFMEVVSIEMA